MTLAVEKARRSEQGQAGGAPELTVRGIILGAAITVVFMAANVYLGLKTGMTFSSWIPAAVISMSVLRMLGPSGILENNIVQTQASAAGTLCNVILVLPGLLLIGYWHDFQFWQTMAVCLIGGLFGVAYSVPLRRVMVLSSDLPFPEGVAAAEVLRAGHEQEGQGRQHQTSGLRELAVSAAAAGFFNLVASGVRLVPDKLIASLSYGHAALRLGGSLSLALIGVGYLVRIGACLALFLGVFIAWGVSVPLLMTLEPSGNADLAVAAQNVWSSKVRLIGAGIIAIGGLWTVITLVKPMFDAVRAALKEGKQQKSQRSREDSDVPIAWIGAAIVVLLLLTGGLFAWFAAEDRFGVPLVWVVLSITVLTAIIGLLMASACGYMAALLGSSCSPISGIGILTTILVAAGFGFAFPEATAGSQGRTVVALTLFMTSVIVTISSIANDNLQDLKTGNLVGAMPWRQQAALAIGVVAGAVTIAPVLQLLYQAYGFSGALPRPGMNPGDAMPAPQAALMTQIASGIVGRQLPWSMVCIGAGLGVELVVLESWLRRKGYSLPALTVGIGVYLPSSVSVTIGIGGVISWLTERVVARQTKKRSADELRDAQSDARHRGVLIGSGFLVGESLAGIFIAAADALAGRSGSLALFGTAQSGLSTFVGVLAFALALTAFYRSVARSAKMGS